MDIYIGKEGLVLGPYYPDEIQKRLDDDRLDGTELAWHEGLEEWVNVKELPEGEAPAPEAEETSIETAADEEPEPLDEEKSVEAEVADGVELLNDELQGDGIATVEGKQHLFDPDNEDHQKIKAAIRKATEKSSDELTKADLEQVTELSLSNTTKLPM